MEHTRSCPMLQIGVKGENGNVIRNTCVNTYLPQVHGPPNKQHP